VASQGRQPDPDVSSAAQRFAEIARRMRAEPFSFGFFQAVSLLERMRPDRAPVGQFSDPRREAARFGAYPTLAFPASDIQEIDWSADPPLVMVNFMGLTGAQGVLPRVYTELIEERGRMQDRSLRDFLDLINHRLISMFYRAWTHHRLTAEPRRFEEAMISLVGLGTPGLERRLSVEDDSLMYYCGLLALQPRSAAALEQLLEDYFRVPVEVVQFVGAWYRLDPDSICRMEERGRLADQLGFGAVVGDEVWNQQSRVRIRLGPLTMQQYDQFLPGRLGNRRLRDLTRFFSRGELDFDAQLILRREDVPECRVTESSPEQLGWTTWMKTKPSFPRNPEDTIVALD
jgi:type VI secretion system protein ImpH